MVFFKCIATLFDPVHRRGERTKWGLVLYTTIMFCATTVLTGLGFTIQSDSSIDNREFPGIGDTLPPGPLGYQSFTFADVLTLVSNPMFFLSGWLADGLLVTLCSFPCSLTWVADIGPLSSTAATLSTLRTAGSSPSPPSCTSDPWVRTRVPTN